MMGKGKDCNQSAEFLKHILRLKSVLNMELYFLKVKNFSVRMLLPVPTIEKKQILKSLRTTS
jgi:hypothetical protein